MSAVARRGKQRIRPPRRPGTEVSIPDIWASLSDAIGEIHKHNAAELSFEENYRYAYNLVLHKQGDMLYQGVKQLVIDNINKLARDEIQPAFPTSINGDPIQQTQEAERLLKAVRSVWDDHLSNMSKLRDLLRYMDRVYAPAKSVPVIMDAGLQLFHEHMIKQPILQHIVDALLSQIHIEREGYAINQSAVKSCVDVFLRLSDEKDNVSVYKKHLEPAILKESEAFYRDEGSKLLETYDTPEFLRRVETRFIAEDLRAHHYLSSRTAVPLKVILEENLLTPHLDTILSLPSGLESMIDLDKIDDLARLYRLFVMVPKGLNTLRRFLKESVLKRGKDFNETSEVVEIEAQDVNLEDTKGKGKGKSKTTYTPSQMTDTASKWVEMVLTLKDKFDRIWKTAFCENHEIETALNEAFETFINLNTRAPEYISLYIDENLKKGLKGKSDQDVDAVLDKTIIVFRYITEQDVFERYYKIHLSKRLLYGRSVSDDAERAMIAKLKIECGFQFTQKLEGMFNDMRLSSEAMDAYRRHLSKAVPLEVEMSVTVMTSTFWPMTHSNATCNMPDILIKATKSFESFYLSRHSGRRLTWQLSLGNADVKVAFKAKKHDLNVSTFALIILLLFENVGNDEFLTYEEIQSATDLKEAELKRNLQSLACAKYKILKKHPPSRDVKNDDSFSFNEDFTSPLQRIKIGTISTKVENPEERKETRDRIEEERRHQTEACIVRIMKNRKHMIHTELVNEVTRQLSSRFQPNPLNIKKRIEGLIEREYLERCDDKRSYNYLA